MLEQKELNKLVLRAVNTLPYRLRITTILYYYEYLSIREIAPDILNY